MQTLLHLTIFIIISLDITCLGNIPEYFLHDGGSGHCGQTIDSTQSVFVKSHDGAGLFDGLSSYTANQNCEVTYNAETGKSVLIIFSFFDLQPPALSVCHDGIQITELDEETTSAASGTTQGPTSPPTVTTEVQNTTESNVTAANATTENATIPSTAPTTQTSPPPTTSPQPSEPSGVNATFWNTTEVCNVTAVNATVNETLCWNETESYVVFIPHTSPTPSSSSSAPPTSAGGICVNPGTYVSNSSSIKIKFVSDGSVQRGGFSLLLTSFHTGTCSATEFSCDTDRCISNQLKCDGVNHCVDGTDESQHQAGCPSDEPATSGLSSYAILGIVLLASGVLLTVFTMIIVWKYLGSGGSCKCKTEVEDDVEELSPPSKAPEVSKPVKPKKSVKINVTEKKASIPDVEEPPRTKRLVKKKVEPLVAADVDW